MVATLVSLRLRLLKNGLFREVWRAVFAVLGLLYGLGMLAMVTFGTFFARTLPAADRSAGVVLVGAVLVLGWLLVPLLAFGVDDSLDPQRFGLFTTPSWRFGIGLIVAGAISLPGLFTVLAVLAVTPIWLPSPLAIAGWLVSGLSGALLCFIVARVGTTAAATGLRSRRGRDAVATIGLLLVLVVAFTPAFLGDGIVVEGQWGWFAAAAVVLSWTPLGAPWAIAGDLAQGAYGLAAGHLAITAATIGALLWVWTRILTPAMELRTESAGGTVRGAGNLALVGRLTRVARLPEPAAAVAVRSLRYWLRDPRYVTQLAAIVLMGPFVAAMFIVNVDAPLMVLLLVPVLLAGFAGWAVHNDVAYDSTALWMHVITPVSGVNDRLGRAAGFAILAVPLLVVMALAAAVISGAWDYLPAALGASLGVFGAGLGVSMVASALVAYPVPPPGASPFTTTGMGAVGVTLIAQTGTTLATFVLTIPTLATLIPVFLSSTDWGWLTLGVGALSCVGLVWLGITTGGRIYERRAAGILQTMSGWTGH